MPKPQTTAGRSAVHNSDLKEKFTPVSWKTKEKREASIDANKREAEVLTGGSARRSTLCKELWGLGYRSGFFLKLMADGLPGFLTPQADNCYHYIVKKKRPR